MQAIVAHTLRACSRTLPAKSLASRVAVSVPRRGFLIVPSYKSRIAVAFRGYATTTAAKKTTAKKPTAKKTTKTTTTATRKKAVAKKAATKSKPKAKAAKKKPAPKPKVAKKKKELSPEQKALAQKRELRKDSLAKEQPTKLPFTAWLVFCQSQTVGSTGGSSLGAKVKEIAAEFKRLSPSERERLTEEAQQNKTQNIAEFKKWVESHPVDVIRRANRARARLDRVHKVRISPLRIVDERQPKRPAAAFAMYIRAHAQEFPAGANADAPSKLKALAQQWRTLDAAEKKAFFDLSAAERTKFSQEHPRL